MRRTRVLALAAAILLLAGVQVWAHHAFASEFDVNKPVHITGTVTKLELVNPHAWIYVDVKDASGKVTLVRCRHDPETKSGTPGADKVKVKGAIHWLSAQHAFSAKVRLYDRLFRVPNPGAGERDFLERPLDFRKWRPSLGDAHAVHGASYLRPPAEPIPLDRLLADGETFAWRSWELRCVATPGSSPGG